MNINTHEVINAAKTKWNFIDFRPGLVGGHCIGVDPYYLIYKSKKLGYTPNLLLEARYINNKMSKFVIQKFIYFAGQRNMNIKKLKVLVLGITFKENWITTYTELDENFERYEFNHPICNLNILNC